MAAQLELTKRFSAESSIRAYIAHDPERAFRFFEAWATDTNAHVRRLVSEGTRLRLPWARRVSWLDHNPTRVLALLELLKDDPSTMVRRSVANNLNDLGKVWPDLLRSTAAEWLEDASPERRSLVEHALRSAIKRTDRAALALLGFGETPRVSIEAVAFSPRRVRIGERVTMTFQLKSRTRRTQQLLVDVAVHFVKAHGVRRPKVFKLGRIALAPGERADLRTGFSLAVHTTRVPRAGRHRVEVLVNGRAIPAGHFDVI
ncbi:MAG TPA: DNA alkylation repair protein, partial [Vicinamibacterales bacterium]|nr:DNA alkylation repair protein [Vicinamibacterales bacterium]